MCRHIFLCLFACTQCTFKPLLLMLMLMLIVMLIVMLMLMLMLVLMPLSKVLMMQEAKSSCAGQWSVIIIITLIIIILINITIIIIIIIIFRPKSVQKWEKMDFAFSPISRHFLSFLQIQGTFSLIYSPNVSTNGRIFSHFLLFLDTFCRLK